MDRAVITVPAYFNDAQRQATKDAGRLAGLEVLRLVNEPTAAALAYGLHKQKRGHVAVYDFGGGTFDISVLKLISTNEGDIYQVLSTNGDTHLGGDDIDNALMDLARREIQKKFGVELDHRGEAMQTLRKDSDSREARTFHGGKDRRCNIRWIERQCTSAKSRERNSTS